MGAFDDILADVPGAAAASTGGSFDDVTQGLTPGLAPPGPDTARINWGPFGHSDYKVDPNGFMGGTALPFLSWLNEGANSVVRGGVNSAAMVPEALYASFLGPNAGKMDIKPEDAYQPHWGVDANDAIGVPARPADAGFGTDVLEGVGGSLVVPGGGSGGFLRGLGTEVASSVGSVLGTDLGGWIGEQLGGERGKAAGEFAGGFGGGAAPSVGRAVGDTALRSTFAKENGGSGVAYDALERAGIRPSPALVGNKQAARTMNSAANFPLVGGTVQARQHASFEDFQRSLYDATDQIGPRAQPGVEEPRPPQMVGGRMRAAANQGNDNLDAYFGEGYRQVNADVPPQTLVRPDNVDAAMTQQGDRLTGESRATQGAVQGWYDTEITPALVGEQGPQRPFQGPTQNPSRTMDGPRQGPVQPGAPQDVAPPPNAEGVPFQVARKAGTEAFYDAQGGKMAGGAVEQVRQAWNADTEAALMNDPRMRAAWPNEADRAAQVQRLRVLNTEYALAGARDVSRAGAVPGAGDRLYVGGDRPALDRIANAPDDIAALNRGSEPGHMAVLQRTAPNYYPSLAADVVRQEAQGKAPYGDINVSPQVFSRWWNSLDENSKLIFTNERSHGTARSINPTDPNVQAIEAQPTPTMNHLDTLGQAGELFRQAGAEANPSGTAPTLAMMGLMAGALTHPMSTLGGLVSGGALARGMSGVEMAQTIAGRGRSVADYMVDAMRRGAGHEAARLSRPNYGGPR